MIYAHDKGKNEIPLCNGDNEVVSVEMGGTGAKTAAEARKNLGIIFDSGIVQPNEPIAAGAYVDLPIVFNKNFTKIPVIEFFLRSATTAGNFGRCTAAYVPNSGTAEGCTIRIFNGDSSVRQPAIEWHAWSAEIAE